MNLTEDRIIEKNVKHCGHCNRTTLLPYRHELICVSCLFILIKRKHEISKIQRQKTKIYQLIKICRTQNFLYKCSYTKTM